VGQTEKLILSSHLDSEGITMTYRFLSASLILALVNLGNLPNALGTTPLKIVQADSNPISQIPETLKVPSNQRLILKVAAKGWQIYSCKANAGDNTGYGTADETYEWTLKAPSAELLNDQGQPIGKHFAGPTWEMLEDRSKVVGVVSVKANAPQTDAIPWLLISAKSHQGEGILSPVTWIQRLETVGGKAPAMGCDRTNQTKEVRVPYTANYYFYSSEK
jgi:Protein of unknown function (DUF3455)